MEVKVGLIQMTCSDNSSENLDKIIVAIRDLAKRGAQIISTSELPLSTYFCQSKDDARFALAEPIPGPSTDKISPLAAELNAVVLLSLFEKSDDGKFYNTVAVIDADGKYLGKYRKMHIPNDPANGYDEAYYFAKGDEGFKVFETKFSRIAPMICYDQWFPEGARVAAAKGAQILFYPTAIGWPQVQREELNKAEHEAWQIMHRSHAIANNVFVCAINRVGLEGGLKFWGTSFVSDPYGRVLELTGNNGESLSTGGSEDENNLLATCDLAVTDEMRKDWPFLDQRVIKCEYNES